MKKGNIWEVNQWLINSLGRWKKNVIRYSDTHFIEINFVQIMWFLIKKYNKVVTRQLIQKFIEELNQIKNNKIKFNESKLKYFQNVLIHLFSKF